MSEIHYNKLNKQNTIELNKIIDEIKVNFIKEIEIISKKQPEKLKWYATPFGSKNTYICKVLEQIGFILLAQKKVQVENINKIIVRNRTEKKILSKIIESRVKIEVDLKYILMDIQIFKDFLYLMKYLLIIVFHYISYKLAKINIKRIESKKNELINIAETILYANSFTNKAELKDRHLGNVWCEAGSKKYIIFPLVYGFFNFYKFYKLAIKSKYKFIFVQDLLSIFDAVEICIEVRKWRLEPIPKFQIEGIDFSSVVSNSLRRHKYKPSTLYGYARYKAIKNMENKYNWTVKEVLRWHENHEVDHMSVLAWHSLNNKPFVTGYVDVFPARNFLAQYVTKDEIESESYPDKQLFIGEFWRREFGSFIQHAPHSLANSIRFKEVWNFNKPEAKSNHEEKIILVSLPPYNPEKGKILDVISQLDWLLNNRESKKYRCIIRPHPADSTQIKLKCNKLRFQIDRNSKFDKLLEQSEIVISSISSVQLQAILNGKRAVTISSLSRISSCSVPKDIYKYGYDEIYDANQLMEILTKLEDRLRAPINDLTRNMFVGRNLNRLY
jgi:hypothetical protein